MRVTVTFSGSPTGGELGTLTINGGAFNNTVRKGESLNTYVQRYADNVNAMFGGMGNNKPRASYIGSGVALFIDGPYADSTWTPAVTFVSSDGLLVGTIS